MGILDNMFGGKPKLEEEDNVFGNGKLEEVEDNIKDIVGQFKSELEENTDMGVETPTLSQDELDLIEEVKKKEVEEFKNHIKSDGENLRNISSIGKE